MATPRELVEQLFEAALTLSPPERNAFLDKSCGSDTELRRKVEDLLEEDARAGSFLEHPPFHLLHDLVSNSHTDKATQSLSRDGITQGERSEGRLRPGEFLSGRFEVLRFLNRGGMGEVYEAWDSDLRETVALKTIRSGRMSDPTIVDYFKEEVKQARQIAHPNVCRVYDLYSHGNNPADRIWFLAMQLLDGVTLSEHLRDTGPFSRKDAYGLIQQLVSGLAAAHELGVVHRDVKSANVMLVPAPGGKIRAVITDFGLAKRITAAAPFTSGRGGEGTPAYVAPEQWRRGDAGPQADQYALGVVICEMITGERPIPAKLDGPEPLPARLPAGRKIEDRWERVIRRCLEVKPEDRFGSVLEILPALDPQRRPGSTSRWLAAVVGLPITAAAVVLLVARVNLAPAIQNLKQITPLGSLSANPSLSSDGKTIAYSSNKGDKENVDIWIQHLPGAAVQITSDPATDDEPSLSPDGHTVVFRSERAGGGIYISDAAGGGERLLVKGGRGPRFSPDGRSIIYWTGDDNMVVASGRIYLLNLASGMPVQLATEFTDAREPIWNSDGYHILFNGCSKGSETLPDCFEWWVTTTKGDNPHPTGAKHLLDLQQLKQIGDFGGWYGDTVLFSAGTEEKVDSDACKFCSTHREVMHLWELDISPKDSAVKGKPRELPDDARVAVTSSSLARNVVAFTDLPTAFNIWRIDYGHNPAQPKADIITQDADLDNNPYISQNGRWLTFIRGSASDRGVWIRNMTSGKEFPFPVPGSSKSAPIISNDGSTLLYEAREKTREKPIPAIYVARSGTEPSRLCAVCRNPTGWFDDKGGFFHSDASMSQVMMYSFRDRQSRAILSKQGAYVAEATWSPANEYLLFTVSTKSGNGNGGNENDADEGAMNSQVFVAHFPLGAKVPDSMWIPITDSSESSEKPRWSGDGKTIFYLSNRDSFWCVWGRHFDPASRRIVGNPFVVQHYHEPAFSPYPVASYLFNLSVAGDLLYLNVAHISGTIYTGQIERQKYLPKSLDR